jgi:hypothetical protein
MPRLTSGSAVGLAVEDDRLCHQANEHRHHEGSLLGIQTSRV